MSVLKYATQEASVNGTSYPRRLLEDIVIERSLQNGFFGFLSQTTYRARLSNLDGELNAPFGAADQRGVLATAKRWDAIAGGGTSGARYRPGQRLCTRR